MVLSPWAKIYEPCEYQQFTTYVYSETDLAGRKYSVQRRHLSLRESLWLGANSLLTRARVTACCVNITPWLSVCFSFTESRSPFNTHSNCLGAEAKVMKETLLSFTGLSPQCRSSPKILLRNLWCCLSKKQKTKNNFLFPFFAGLMPRISDYP